MMHRKHNALVSFTKTAGIAVTCLMLTACKKPPPPPPPAPPPPPPPKVPDPIDLAPVIQASKPDARVNYAQQYAPTDETLAKAVIGLADAIAKGDSAKLSGMLAPESKGVLDALTSNGGWEEGTAKIEAVRVVQFNDLTAGGPGGGPGGSGACTAASLQLAIQEPGEAYLVAWNATRVGDKWVFTGSEAPDTIKRRASEFDGGADTGVAAAPGADPSAAAAGNPIEQKAFVTTYLAVEIQKRVMNATGQTFDLNAAKAQASAMGFDVAQLDAALAKGKELSRQGVMPDAPMLAVIYKGAKTMAQGKATDDQVIQWMSNIIAMPEKTLRDQLKASGALDGGGPAPSSGGRGNSRGGG